MLQNVGRERLSSPEKKVDGKVSCARLRHSKDFLFLFFCLSLAEWFMCLWSALHLRPFR